MREEIKTISKKITLNKLLKLSIILTVLVIAFSVLWSFVITPYRNRKLLDNCLNEKYEKHKERWKEYCKIDNKPIGADGFCLLSSNRADELNKYHLEIRNDCFKKYPVK